MPLAPRIRPPIFKSGGATLLTVSAFQTVTQKGGTVGRSGDTLLYAPPAGYLGLDEFEYTVADGSGLPAEKALVTVHVVPGDLVANDDAFIVGFEWDGQAQAPALYALGVLGNDAVFPAGAAVPIRVTPNFGIGDNAPKHGATLAVSGDGQAVLFRPGMDINPNDEPAKEYVETFTYEVEDAFGRKQAARVAVTVRVRAGAVAMETQDDHFNVERDSAKNVLPVAANDLVEPKGPVPGLALHVTATTASGGHIEASGGNLVYTPPTGFIGIDTAAYTITDGIGGSGTATVTIHVGALPTAPHKVFAALRGETGDFDVLPRDAITGEYLAGYRDALSAVTATHGAAAAISAGSTILFTPDPGYAGTYPYEAAFAYELRDRSGRVTTGAATVIVYDPAGGQSTGIVTIIKAQGGTVPPGSPRDLWNKAHFGDDYAANPDALGGADPDGDGLDNDAEYAFGGDPNAPGDTRLGLAVGRIYIRILPDDTVDIYYVRRNDDPALAFALWACDDLIASPWYPEPLNTLSTDPADPAGEDLVIAIHNLPRDHFLRRFFQIRVTLP